MATYYISNSGLAGNNGITPATSWPLSKVASFAFAAGDFILFNKGETFTGTTNFTRSGTAGNPITFDLYGTATNNATLDGAASANPTLKLTTCNYITINNLVIQNSTSVNGTFHTTNCSNLIVYNCYINIGIRTMFVQFHTNGLIISGNYFQNFADNATHTHGGGSAIQVYQSTGSGYSIVYNKCYTVMVSGSATTPGVGDVINLYQSYGLVGNPIIVQHNQIRGGSSNLNGYAALIGGDVGGAYQDLSFNLCVDSGRVGAQVQGGTNITMSNNIIYSNRYPFTSVGLSFGNYSGVFVGNITMASNSINFPSADNGYALFNKWWDTRAQTFPAFQPTGWTSNSPDNVASTASNNSILPTPLFNFGDWNTVTATTTTTTTTTTSTTTTTTTNPNFTFLLKSGLIKLQ